MRSPLFLDPPPPPVFFAFVDPSPVCFFKLNDTNGLYMHIHSTKIFVSHQSLHKFIPWNTYSKWHSNLCGISDVEPNPILTGREQAKWSKHLLMGCRLFHQT